jgi:hypothetical protein
MSEVVNSHNPISFGDGSETQKWKDAMQIEYDMLMKRKTWKLSHTPKAGGA